MMSRRKIKVSNKRKKLRPVEVFPKLALENVLNIKRGQRKTQDEEDIFALIMDGKFDIDKMYSYKYIQQIAADNGMTVHRVTKAAQRIDEKLRQEAQEETKKNEERNKEDH